MNEKDREKIAGSLQQEFRKELEGFYAALHLAVPYHSLEQAIQCFRKLFNDKPDEEKIILGQEALLKWSLFQQAFVDSGLNKKHRGIISNLAHSQPLSRFPLEHQYLLKPFLKE